MADLVVTRYTTLAPEEVLVRAVQFFTNENWRAQSQTSRIATFVGVPRLPWFHLMIALFLTFCFVIPGLIYYFFVIRRARRLQNLVVTTSPQETGCGVVVSYPSHAQKYVDRFFAALPERARQQGTAKYCLGCGKENAEGVKFCTSCGAPSPSAVSLPPA